MRSKAFLVLCLAILILTVPLIGNFFNSGLVPEHWSFQSWPFWLKAVFVAIAGLSFLLEVYFACQALADRRRKSFKGKGQ